jgi:hypothetical protein
LNGFFLFLLPEGLLARICPKLCVRLAGEDLEEEVLALLMLQEQLEEEWDLREGVELLQPHAPALSQCRRLPQLQGGESNRDDLSDPSFGLKLGKKAHLGYIKSRNLLEHRLWAVALVDAVDCLGALENLLFVVLEVENSIQRLGIVSIFEELRVERLYRKLVEVGARTTGEGRRDSHLAVALQ